jgi:hypothetical protein
MRRRGREVTAAHTEYWLGLYEQTVGPRRQRIRENEQRRLRLSV